MYYVITAIRPEKDARVSAKRRSCFHRKTLVFPPKDARVSTERRSCFSAKTRVFSGLHEREWFAPLFFRGGYHGAGHPYLFLRLVPAMPKARGLLLEYGFSAVIFVAVVIGIDRSLYNIGCDIAVFI